MKKELSFVALSDCVLYILHFIVIPAINDDFIKAGRNESWGILVITTLIITIIGMLIFSDKFKWWIIGVVLYAGLMTIYTPEGAYGIGMVGLFQSSHYNASERGFGIIIVSVWVIFFQFVSCFIVQIVKVIIWFIRKRKE